MTYSVYQVRPFSSPTHSLSFVSWLARCVGPGIESSILACSSENLDHYKHTGCHWMGRFLNITKILCRERNSPYLRFAGILLLEFNLFKLSTTRQDRQYGRLRVILTGLVIAAHSGMLVIHA